MLFSVSLARKLGAMGVVSVSLDPGVIYTHLSRDVAMEDFKELGKHLFMGMVPSELCEMTDGGGFQGQLDRIQGHKAYWDQPLQIKTLAQGVATHVYGAFHPDLDLAGKSDISFPTSTSCLGLLIKVNEKRA